MMTLSFVWRPLAGVMVGVLLAAASVPTASAEPRDPLVRVVPEERPALRELLTGDEFETRYAAAVERLGDWAAWEESNAPVLGLSIKGVFPGGQVQGVISPGDVLTRSDGVLLWGDEIPDSEAPRDVEFYAAKTNTIETIRVQPGLLGLQSAVYWRPELAYLRSAHRDPAWDMLVLAAIGSRGSDPDLAETALAMAVRAGHPRDEVTAQIAAEIALMQNRPEVAAGFAWFAEQALDPTTDTVSPMLLFRVALANYHLHDALRIAQMEPVVFERLHPAALKRLIELHESRSEGQRMLPPPSVHSEKMYHDPLTPRLVASDRTTAEYGLPQLLAGEPLTLKARTAHFQSRIFEPLEPTPNLEITMQVSATPDGTTINEYLRWFYFSLQAMNHPETAADDPLYRSELMKLAISEFGDIRFQFGNSHTQFTFLDPTVKGLSGKPYNVRVMKVGGQAEVFLNGHRIYYGPLPTDSPSIQFEYNVTGSQATVEIEAVELIAQP